MIALPGNPTELKDDSILSDKMVMWFPHLHQFLKQRICLRWVWKQYVYICARMEVCETDPKTTWSNFAPCDLVTSEDFHSCMRMTWMASRVMNVKWKRLTPCPSWVPKARPRKDWWHLSAKGTSCCKIEACRLRHGTMSKLLVRLQNHALITSWHWQRHWKMQDMVPPMRSLLRPRVNSLTMCLGHKLSHATLKISFPSINLYICGFCGYSIQLL